jgi:type IV pilus assembly protein PilY1
MDIMIRKILLSAIFASIVASIGVASADDTDIYLNVGAGLPENSEPLVMFSLDYRPNLGSTACSGNTCDLLIAEGYMSPTGPYTFFDVLRGALRKVFDPLEGVRVGLMLNHDNSTNCAGFGRTKCSNGGYIAMGFELFEANDANGAKARFHATLDAMPIPKGNGSHSYQGKELFFEFFRYLTGQGVYNAHNGFTDYGTINKFNLDYDYPAFDWDSSIETGVPIKPKYVSPLADAGECTSIYTINTVFQVSNQDADSDAAIAASISNGGFGSAKSDFSDVIQYLNDADLANGNYGTVPDLADKQNVTSYFIVDPTKINTKTTAYARAGGTGTPLALSEDPGELVSTLQEIFKQILSVSTTFVAASVPVNVFNRAEITDNVYIALFQVDRDGKPSWVGNVKKLKMAGGVLPTDPSVLVDANGNSAIAADGRIRFDALTYWTAPGDLPPADESEGQVEGRDGRVVARGGAGQQMPGYVGGSPQMSNGLGGRTLFYDASPSSLASLNVNIATASALASAFGVSTVTESAELIAYARGLDIDDLDGDSEVDEAREWVFADPLHSRPLPLNYGSRGGHTMANPAIYLAVASNDGFLHMLRNTTSGATESGEEIWAFMPKVAMPVQKTLRNNATGIRHPYTVDGAPVAYIEDKNQNGTIESGESAYLYVGLRRGGKAYYAFDISNPEAPDLMWTLDKSGDFAELGYTFSDPRVGLVDTGNGPRPVLMFAGGYDTNKDSAGIGTNDSEGNVIYVVDAKTGNLIWKARGGSGGSSGNVFEHSQLVDSIPSNLTIADTDGDSLTDRILVGDTGGNIWRADLHGTDVGDWNLSLIAAVGRHATGASGNVTDRRFFHRPDLVQAEDDDGVFDAVLIGSGNRADPLDKGGTAANYFYMIKDRNVVVGSGAATHYEHPDFGDITNTCIREGAECTADLTVGWKLQMETNGEKILATALTINGKVFFTSFYPQGKSSSSSACAPSEGSGRLYAVALQTGRSVINYDTTDDDDDNPGYPTTKSDRSTDLNSGGIPAEVVTIPPSMILRPDLQIDNIDVKTRWRTYWHLQEDVDGG